MAAVWLAHPAYSSTISTPNGALSVRVDETAGTYELQQKEPAWTFAGELPAPLHNVTTSHGRDNLGAYQQVDFSWTSPPAPITARIRLYQEEPLALFSSTCSSAVTGAPAPFPRFTRLPADLHIFSHSLKEFGPPVFGPSENGTPWLLFDDRANALVISPAAHFMVARMSGDGRQVMACGCSQLAGVSAGFTQQTLVALAPGINRTWAVWGRGLLKLLGAQRPRYDADPVLKYLGYWTDNGAAYYYNYDPERGYAGTLQALVEQYRRERIPLHYLQLDSWWYSKSCTGADGTPGAPKKVAKLPEGEWNRYGGTLEYKAHPFLFTNGLAAFQKSIGLPLVTHSRWIDPASPYHQQFAISGIAPVDPKWWDEIAGYLKASGVITYEQDWLDRIYSYSPAFSTNLEAGEAFLDNMARACRDQGITLQYCMPYACYFLQGCRYENLTTIRTATDRFNPNRWNDFLYTSCLAASLGIWPWADVYRSTERDNVLLSTLSAGPVGIGDALGSETTSNLFQAVRADGVIVKPDAPIVPTDRSYVADAQGLKAPLTSSTFTDRDGIRTLYLFACARPKMPGGEVRFVPAELGVKGPAYVYDGFARTGRRVEDCEACTAQLARGGTAFYIMAPVGKSGIAFLGDPGKFVGTGKQRVAALHDEPGRLTAKLVLAEAEPSVLLHGYAPFAPKAVAASGEITSLRYDTATQHFELEARPDPASPLDRTTGEPVRQMTVSLSEK